MRFFKILHFLSLDVVFGACLFQSLLTTIFLDHKYPPLMVTISLAFVVWTIYLVDRLIDNRKPILGSLLHEFHHRYAQEIKYVISFNIVFLMFIIKYLPKYLIIGAIVIGLFLLIYWGLMVLGLFGNFKHIKELSTAGIYTAGVFIYVYLNMFEASRLILLAMVFLVFLLVLQNLVLFTLLSQADRSKNIFLKFIELLFFGCWIFNLFCSQINIFFLLPFLITYLIHLWIHYISTSKKVAWLGEIAFFSPLFYYLYAIIST